MTNEQAVPLSPEERARLAREDRRANVQRAKTSSPARPESTAWDPNSPVVPFNPNKVGRPRLGSEK